MNPAPFRPLFDVILAGEAEAMGDAPETIAAATSREEAVALAQSYPFAVIEGRDYNPARSPKGSFAVSAHPKLFPLGNLFGNRFILELNRGCPGGCKFCAARVLYHPYREAAKDTLVEAAQKAAAAKHGLALMGTSLDTVSFFDELLAIAFSAGVDVSLSSLRLKGLTDARLALLAKLGVRTITAAIESAIPETRQHIGKPLDDAEIEEALARIKRHGLSAKLYLVAGVPGSELKHEAEGVGELLGRIAAHNNLPQISVSAAPFAPKPGTPWEHEPMPSKQAWRTYEKTLKQSLAGTGVAIELFSYHESLMQTFLNRGGTDVIRFLEAASRGLKDREALKECGIDIENKHLFSNNYRFSYN